MTIYKANSKIRYNGSLILPGEIIEGAEHEFDQQVEAGALTIIEAKDTKAAAAKIAKEKKAAEEAAAKAEEEKPEDTWGPQGDQNTWQATTPAAPEAPAPFEVKPIGTAAEGEKKKESATGDAIPKEGDKPTSPDETGENL